MFRRLVVGLRAGHLLQICKLSLYLPIYPSVYLSICLSLHLSVYLSIPPHLSRCGVCDGARRVLRAVQSAGVVALIGDVVLAVAHLVVGRHGGG